MTNISHDLVIGSLYCMMVLVLMFLAGACGQDGDLKNDEYKLTTYCIRQCVLDTSASEICDTKCRCATQKLSSGYSNEEFSNLVQIITQAQADVDGIEKFKDALDSCKDLDRQ